MDFQRFLTGFVSPDWCDTDMEISGYDLWCAVIKPASRRHYGKVIGFVQSVYLFLPPDDAPLFYSVATPAPQPALTRRRAE